MALRFVEIVPFVINNELQDGTLGEMLLEAGRPDDALKEFELTMKKEPNRFRGVYGAARAAELGGDGAKARAYYAKLLEICEQGDRPGRSELEEARKAVGD